MIRALSRAQRTHVVWVLYSRLLVDAKHGVVDVTTDELGARIGISRTTTKLALKILRQLEMIEGPHAVGEGWQIRVFRDGTAKTLGQLQAIAAGAAEIDMQSGEIVFAEQAPLELFEDSGHSTDHSGASSVVSFSNTLLNTYKTNSTSEVEKNDQPLPDKKPGRNGKRYTPLTDEHRPTIERIQAFSNELFKTSHGLLNAAGHEIGKAQGVSGRYGIIRRALVEWGFSEEQLKGALSMAAKDPWWAERRINDTANLFRKLQHIQKWVDAWASGGKLANPGKWDKKQTGLGMSTVTGADGKIDRSKIESEVF